MNTVADPLVADTGSIDVSELSHFKTGRAIENWLETHWLRASNENQDGEPDDVLQSYLLLPIYSFRLRESLVAARINRIQYLPISVFTSTGRVVEGYCVANFLDCVPALDLQRSKFSRFGPDWADIDADRVGRISGVLKAVLVASELGGFDIIRTEEYKQDFYVSERFKNIFESNRFTGYSFREVVVT